MMRVANETFLHKPLRVHTFLRDVPLHDVWVLDLRGGGEGRTLDDLWKLMKSENIMANPGVAFLFKLRRFLGTLFRWDTHADTIPESSYIYRLPEIERQQVAHLPKPAAIFRRTIYQMPSEGLYEIINNTVHAFGLLSLEPTGNDYQAYMAVYVKSLSRLTPLYMLLIDPFRYWIVYPSLIRKIEEAWAATYVHSGG